MVLDIVWSSFLAFWKLGQKKKLFDDAVVQQMTYRFIPLVSHVVVGNKFV